jgi:hypothetical protein
MPDAELTLMIDRLRIARTPTDVFGALEGSLDERRAQLKASYRRLSKAAHPDRFADAADRARATDAFARLTDWLHAARAQLDHGADGADGHAAPAPVRVQVGRREYLVGDRLAQGDLCTLYHCTGSDGAPAVLKLARDPADNDLVTNEVDVLRQLAISPALAGYRPYLPTLLDSFEYAHETVPAVRRANLLARLDGFVSLRVLRAAFPAGLPPEHMGWIWRRLLVALAVTHRAGFVHGAVLPDHVLIHPTARGLVLVDWSYAVPLDADRPIAAVSTAYAAWYPVEVWRKQPPTAATDLYLGARCMLALLGGDPLTGALPPAVPARIQLFLTGTARPRPAERPQDAAAVLAEFDALLAALYGRRRYSPLHLPGRNDHACL